MTIPGFEQEQIAEIIAENLTPSTAITTPERLFGREQLLRDVQRALNSRGRPVFIHGDRGVGKSSLALTAANLVSDVTSGDPINVVCGRDDTFGQVIQAIGHSAVRVQDRMERQGESPQLGLSVAGTGGTYSPGTRAIPDLKPPQSLNDALDIVRYVLTQRSGTFVVVIDEMERIQSEHEREKFAEFIKNIPNLDHRVKFIFCGIGSTLNELVGDHESAGRILEPIDLERLHHDHLWRIIETVAKAFGVTVEREALIRIGQISDGFPSYVHLIGDSMFWSMHDDPDAAPKVKANHFRAGIAGALARSEATLRLQYEKATLKTKNTQDYEEALWALADTTSDRRQVTEIYEYSYLRIMEQRQGRKPLPKAKLNDRFHSLRKEGHGRIVVNYGSGWFGFRENIIRGYVRLKAEEQGIQLGRDHSMRSV